MYKLADKNAIMQLFKKGQTVSQIRLTSNVSRSTLYRWQKEHELHQEAKELIQQSKIEELKEAIDEFERKNGKIDELLTSKIMKALINSGCLEYAQELGENFLKQNPNNVVIRNQLATIAMKKGDIETAKRLNNEILQLAPNDLPAMYRAINIAKSIGDFNAAEISCNKILQIYPNNLPARYQLITISKHKKDFGTIEIICNEILQLDPNNLPAMYQLSAIEKEKFDCKTAKKPKKKTKHKKNNKSSEQEKIRQVRRQIYSGKLSLESLEDFQAKLEEMGISSTYKYILLAEACQRQNIPNRTKEFLEKAFKETDDKSLQKIIKGLLQIAQSKKQIKTDINPWDAITNIKTSSDTAKSDDNHKSKVPNDR